jgi:hypothetical protein
MGWKRCFVCVLLSLVTVPSKKVATVMALLTSRDDYYSIDSVLAMEVEADVVMHTSVFMLGDQLQSRSKGATRTLTDSRIRSRADASPLGGTAGSPNAASIGDIARGTTLTVPLWCASALFRAGAASVQSPKLFQPALLDDFKADATLPSLPERSPYMLELGARVAGYLPAAEASRVATAVVNLFLKRFMHVIHVSHAKGHDVRTLRNKLSASEQQRLDRALKDTAARKLWCSGQQLGAPATQ